MMRGLRILAAAMLLIVMAGQALAAQTEQNRSGQTASSPARASAANSDAERLARLRDAARRGDGSASFELAVRHYYGRGVTRNLARALEWVIKSAGQDAPEAQSALGYFYLTGKIVPRDHSAALRWLRAAALHGDADAQNNLGVMHENGHGVTMNYVRAHAWYDLAADGLETARRNRNRLAKRMTAAQIAKAITLRNGRPGSFIDQ